MKTYENDATFQADPGADVRLLRTRLKLSAALRTEGRFDEAGALIDLLVKEHPRTLEPILEKGMLAEDRAAAGKATWRAAFQQWRSIAMRLGGARTKPVAYYEAWYHAALALYKDRKPTEAKQALSSVMRLSNSVGGPEMKQKYMALLEQIK